MTKIPQAKIEHVPLKTIKPFKNNPRDNADAIAQVVASIKAYGFLVPIIIDAKGEIIAGHTRYAAAKILKLTTVPIIRAKWLTPAQVRGFRVVDNRTSEFAKWDEARLADELAYLLGEGIEIEQFGFDDDDLGAVMQAASDDVNIADEEIVVTSKKGAGVSRTAKSMRVKIGDVQFHVATSAYERWLHDLRKANAYDDTRVIQALAKKLGLAYEAKSGESTPVQKSGVAQRAKPKKKAAKRK